MPSLDTLNVIGPPGFLPRTSPDADTSAIVASGVVHVTVRPRIVRPSAARSRTPSCRVVLTKTTLFDGVTVIVATAGPLTVTGTLAAMVVSSTIFTVIAVVPFRTAVTLPTISTVAIAELSDAHRTIRDFGLRSVAVSLAD
jgi:hypothetical protein